MENKITFEQLLSGEKPGLDALGCGYNTFGFYANPQSLLSKIFDFSKNENLKFVNIQSIDHAYCSTKQYESIASYQSELSASVKISGSYELFSGEIEAAFDKETIQNSKYQVNTVISYINKYALFFHISEINNEEGIISCMTDEARQDFEKMNPLELVIKYGTHFTTGIIVGGRSNFLSVFDSSSSDDSTDFRAAAQMSAQGLVWSASISGSVEDKSKTQKFNSEAITHYKTLGGFGGLGGFNLGTPDGFRTWAKSVDENPIFCEFFTDEFDPNLGLAPIWYLSNDTNRMLEIRAAITTVRATLGYLASRSSSSAPDPRSKSMYISGVSITQDIQSLKTNLNGDYPNLKPAYLTYTYDEFQSETLDEYLYSGKFPLIDFTVDWNEEGAFISNQRIESTPSRFGGVNAIYGIGEIPAQMIENPLLADVYTRIKKFTCENSNQKTDYYFGILDSSVKPY